MKNLTLQQTAYRHIRDKLSKWDPRRHGLLSEVSLARDLGISRTPIREAISQLVTEGLVERTNGVGVAVKQLSRRELAELIDIRAELEGYVTARAAKRISDRQLSELREILDEMGAYARKLADKLEASGEWDDLLCQEMRLCDVAFHWMLIEAADVSRAAKIIDDLALMGQRFTSKEQRSVHSLARTHYWHWRIYKAVRSRDARAARRAVRITNRENRRFVLKFYDSRQLEMYSESNVHVQWRAAIVRAVQQRPEHAVKETNTSTPTGENATESI